MRSRTLDHRNAGRLYARSARTASIAKRSSSPRAYLESLPELWAKTSDAGRHAIAEAVFERIDALGATADLPITMRLAEPPEPFDWLRSA